jgi:hypothetical protein
VSNPQLFLYEGSNLPEDAAAPVPFRVNAQGDKCAILAGAHTASMNDPSVMSHFVWVDDNGTLRRLTTTARHCQRGAARTGRLSRGPHRWTHWSLKCGPSTAFEISDDGLKVAVVVSRDTTIDGTWGGDSDTNWDDREDVVAFAAVSGSWANGATTHQVTGNDSPAVGAVKVFDDSPTNYLWRFGDVSFTRDGAGLVFWGGYSAKNALSNVTGYNYYPGDACYPTYTTAFSTTYLYCWIVPTTLNDAWANTGATFSGTYYSYNFATGGVRSLLATSNGGGAAGVANYSTSTQVAPTHTAWNGAQGVIRPFGSFHSRNGHFKYVTTCGALNTSDQTNFRLIGINVRSLATTPSTPPINGHPDGEGFAVANWPSRRGFLSNYPPYGNYHYIYPFHPHMGKAQQVMAKETGWVFFGSHYSAVNATNYVTPNYYFSSGPVHPTVYGDYHHYGAHLEVFAGDVGGRVERLTTPTLGADTLARPLGHIETTHNGRAAAMLLGGSQLYPSASEQMIYVGGISLDPVTGNLLSGSFMQGIHTGLGRVCDSVAHDVTGTRLYDAFVAGTTDENQKQIYEASFPAGSPMALRSVASTARRYNVLHAGRPQAE